MVIEDIFSGHEDMLEYLEERVKVQCMPACIHRRFGSLMIGATILAAD